MLAPEDALVAIFDVKHVSSTFGNESNTAKIDGYTLVDIGATWQRGPVRITLSGRNLFDQEYYFDVGSESADPGPSRSDAPAHNDSVAQVDRTNSLL